MDRETGYEDGPRCECGEPVDHPLSYCKDCEAMRKELDELDELDEGRLFVDDDDEGSHPWEDEP